MKGLQKTNWTKRDIFLIIKKKQAGSIYFIIRFCEAKEKRERRENYGCFVQR